MGRLAVGSTDGRRAGATLPGALLLRLGFRRGWLALAGRSGRRAGRRRVLGARVWAALVHRLAGNGAPVDAAHFDTLLPLALDFSILRRRRNTKAEENKSKQKRFAISECALSESSRVVGIDPAGCPARKADGCADDKSSLFAKWPGFGIARRVIDPALRRSGDR